MKALLTDFRMHDGSRHFVSLPEASAFDVVRQHAARLPGATETDWVSDGVTEMWLDFTFREHTFTVNSQFGEYWFFVENPACDDEILTAVVTHFESLLCP